MFQFEGMRITRMILIFLCLCVVTIYGYDQLDDYDHIMHYYEENSHFPIVHTYYNKHFSSSRQFEDFTNTVEETEYRNKDFAKFLLSDCQKMNQGVSKVCDELKRTKDNHAVVGYFPSGEFINYAGKKMQNPPISRSFRHPSDVYKVEEFQAFLTEMMPNFFETINSMQQFQQWLEPRYSPNLIMVTRQEEIPLVVAQLGVHFFLKFDMGYLNDLTESVVAHLNITQFPALLVLKYSFEEATHELYRYPGKEFSTDNYQDIKAFLEPLALKNPRNDLLFHKMKTPKNRNDVVTTDKVYELAQLLDRSNGWALISQCNSQKPQKLYQLRQKYGQFVEYIHYFNSSQDNEVISLYDPERKRPMPLQGNDIEWRSLSKDEFISNTSIFLSKNFVVMGVRQKYGHICTLALASFFRGLAHCFILKEDDYEATSKQLNMQFDIGFVCYERFVNGTKKVSGNNFNSPNFEDIYLTAEYVQTRLKSKLVIDDFFDKPIKSIEGTDKLAELCAFPFKKCALLFTDSTKQDRTAYDYLKEVAKNFINEYQFYEIDLNCNQHFKEEIQHLKKTTNGLVVFHPRQNEYVYLKAKLSRSTFERFLKANLGDTKKLPMKQWKTLNIQVHSCKPSVKVQLKQKEEREEKAQESVEL